MLQNYGIVAPGNTSLQVIFFHPALPAADFRPNRGYTRPFVSRPAAQISIGHHASLCQRKRGVRPEVHAHHLAPVTADTPAATGSEAESFEGAADVHFSFIAKRPTW